MGKYKLILHEKVQEALRSVLPVALIVLALCFTMIPIPTGMLLSFLMGTVLLIVGMGLFTLGADTAMTPMGEYVGVQVTRSKKLWNIIGIAFFVGFLITISEPDLQVLADQVPSIPNMVLILSVAGGVGFFLVVSMLRILFCIPLHGLLLFFYALVFILAIFVPSDFLAVSFDSGGVTTGPMTVPFIMALGVGVASIRSDEQAQDDSMGLIALCSVGPILAVMLLSLIYRPEESLVSATVIPDITESREMFIQFLKALPDYSKEVCRALGPIVIFFLIFQLLSQPMKKRQLAKIGIGTIYTFLGLVIFLVGVNVGFMPVGNYLGLKIGSMRISWIAIPIGMLIGYFIVAAEPAVHVLTKQVEDITSGAIPRKALSTALGIGVSVSVGLAMIRVLTGISILWFVIPGYLIAFILSFFVPRIFVSIAFDSGGVASGPMTATFLLPFAKGLCEAVGGNLATDAFGVVAMVAMTPLIAIQILGVTYNMELKSVSKMPAFDPSEEDVIDM
ncbi:MAG: DUF1538 domain-containing protein [Lachnospiraceae bacterium]